MESALESDEGHFESGHPSIAIRKSNLALIYKDLGRYEEAIKLAQSAFELFKNALGKEHPHTLTVQDNTVDIARARAEYGNEQCIKYLESLAN